jgi:hypothetical protein
VISKATDSEWHHKDRYVRQKTIHPRLAVANPAEMNCQCLPPLIQIEPFPRGSWLFGILEAMAIRHEVVRSPFHFGENPGDIFT